MGPDERIRHALESLARPAPADGVRAGLVARRARRRIVRPIQAAVLAVGVIAASVASAAGLVRLFDREDGGRRVQSAGPSVRPTPRGCTGGIQFEPTYLPEGFDVHAIDGPAPGAPVEEPGQFVVHYSDGRGRSVEIRTPATLFVELALGDDAPAITVLGRQTSNFGPIEPGGDSYIVQFLYRPTGAEVQRRCQLYSLNEYGLGLDELLRIAEGLEIRQGVGDAEADALLAEARRLVEKLERDLDRKLQRRMERKPEGRAPS